MTKKKEIKEDWEEVLPDAEAWSPEIEGETLTGEILEVFEGMYGSFFKVKVENEKEFLTPCHKLLQEKLETLKVGDYVKIEFRGSRPTKKANPIMLYKVWKKVK